MWRCAVEHGCCCKPSRPWLVPQARLGLCQGDAEAQLQAVGDIYRRLSVLDPMRRGYYQDAADGKAFVVVQALGTV